MLVICVVKWGGIGKARLQGSILGSVSSRAQESQCMERRQELQGNYRYMERRRQGTESGVSLLLSHKPREEVLLLLTMGAREEREWPR